METTPGDPLVGRLLDGRYLIEARVARGGMASVYRATDERLDRSVAVKVMQPALAESEDFVRRFIREAQSAARLSHPHVVNVFDQGRDGDVVFLVMEYVEGRNLRDVLKAAGRLTPGQTVGVLEPIVSAVAAAHRAGIVHRDMKPENVLMATDGRIKVADFGLARAIESSTITMTQGSLIGSPAYLAPEQIERGIADQRADIYAIGVMAFELLTGRPPYSGEVAMAIAMQHVRDDIPAPSTIVTVPAPLDELVVAATRRDPDLRPVDGSAMLARLHDIRRAVPEEALEINTPLVPDHNVTVVLPALPLAPRTPDATPPRTTSLAAGAAADEGSAADPGAGQGWRRRRTGWIWFAVVLLLAGLAAVGVYLAAHKQAAPRPTVSASPTPTMISVPDLTNMTLAEAGTAVPDLVVRKGSEKSDLKVHEGLILSQDPPFGGQLDKGSPITVVLSSGPASRKVPSLTGLRVSDADAALGKVNLVLNLTPTLAFDPKIKPGLVISTVPPAGTTVKEGSTVTVIVSNGPEMVTVLDQRGKTEADATTALKAIGFQVNVTRVFSDTVAQGLVSDQQPFGNQAPKGNAIALTVSKGPHFFALKDYRGMDANEARTALEKLGLKVNLTRILGASTVALQRPGAGTMVKHGDTVSLVAF